jgi:hypothetical protein
MKMCFADQSAQRFGGAQTPEAVNRERHINQDCTATGGWVLESPGRRKVETNLDAAGMTACATGHTFIAA